MSRYDVVARWPGFTGEIKFVCWEIRGIVGCSQVKRMVLEGRIQQAWVYRA